MTENQGMRYLPLALALLATACVDQRYFAPRENENGFGPGGHPAAVYPLLGEDAAGEVRVWSRGSRGDTDGDTGEYTVEWNGRDDGGNSVASGVYFCRLETVDEAIATRMVLIK